MDIDINNYQKIDDQSESPTSQTLEMNDKHLNSEDDSNQITADQRGERKSSLIIIGLISVLTGKILQIEIEMQFIFFRYRLRNYSTNSLGLY
jgi:hypothetical protein